MQADVMAGRQAQPAANVAVEVGQGAAGVVQYIQNLIGPRQQGSSCLGQANLAAEPVEQAHVQLRFQCGDAFADCRLGQMQALRGQGKAARFRDGDKGIEVGQVHERSLSGDDSDSCMECLG